MHMLMLLGSTLVASISQTCKLSNNEYSSHEPMMAMTHRTQRNACALSLGSRLERVALRASMLC